jgi:anti-anti-sigma factor
MTEPQFRHLRCSTQEGVLVLAITEHQVRSGDFELVDALRQEMLEAAGHAGARKVVVDLSAVEYLGSAGFRPLLSLRKRLQEVRGEMLLCGLGPEVHEVLLTSRLINAAGTSDAPFEVAPDLAQAIARLGQPGETGERSA